MEEKIYDALTIAKHIINRIHPEPLTLQKLLYFSQGYNYAFYDRPLFLDDMEGWVHGPVVKNVYHMFKTYKYNPIDLNFEVDELDKDANDVVNPHSTEVECFQLAPIGQISLLGDGLPLHYTALNSEGLQLLRHKLRI